MFEGYKGVSTVKEWQDGDVRYAILLQRLGHYCGYCNFSERPTIEQGYEGILTYVPVHGGITYAEKEKDGTFTYGFDCAHSGDDTNPKCRDMDWLTAETERMAKAIRTAAKYEERYLLARDNETKAAVLDEYHDAMRAEGAGFELTDNFGAMIRCLGGAL